MLLVILLVDISKEARVPHQDLDVPRRERARLLVQRLRPIARSKRWNISFKMFSRA